ncbi:MAG: thiol:disulfide interchange protein DsbA/DsbL [Gammaproteobacteria bacterium]|jgi:thiol:disulfide interchange protein DsbA|nr:thiol:disulfide interchange protein DsbA/DsbL [Gammaproteobacteria bacterium]MBT3870864.1 thiol:disulfide interchange protein DsbA/DsbL [Gammaproteobacteria bacterium]MBT4379778.1 thiol:disulfide interchange protein DsbA/DsbL [Gammaproteobacteria bacterium]MBT4616874.1 thiol:disulfide interchange protein DsbA/DsbL [Gammaproteobacteria bacterium]MBT5197793.1 thiol:disulfide interchange protein DsbA/DsbL [Gammaproteobacteria bacterium]
MARKQSRVLVQQKIAAASLSGVVLAAAAYLFWMTVDDAPQGEFIEGEHYLLIENPRRIRSDQIEVMEFFGYACIHCYNFDPILADWVQEKGGSIKFIQTPAISSKYWRLLGQNFLTYQELGEHDKYHTPFFRAVHAGGRAFTDLESLSEFYEQMGGEKQAYINAFNSAGVASELSKADNMARRLKVAMVPSIVIQGKYLVRTSGSVGPKRMLDVMDYLLEKELAERSNNEPQKEAQKN